MSYGRWSSLLFRIRGERTKFRLVGSYGALVIKFLLLRPFSDDWCCFVDLALPFVFLFLTILQFFWWERLLLLLGSEWVRWRFALLHLEFLSLWAANEFALFLSAATRAVAWLAVTNWARISVGGDWTGFRCWFNICYLSLWSVNSSFKLTGAVVNRLARLAAVFWDSPAISGTSFEFQVQSDSVA